MSVLSTVLPPTAVRVESSTSRRINDRIAQETKNRIASYHSAGRDELTRRIKELDNEWDVERVLETNAATVSLTGAVLAITVHRKFAWISVFVGTFLLQHALQGWCPPVPLLRRAGVRTAREINDERIALMRLRGDFGEQPQRSADI